MRDRPVRKLVRRRRVRETDEVLNPEPLPLQQVLVDERRLITEPWVMMFQRLAKGLAVAESGGGPGPGPGGGLPYAVLGTSVLISGVLDVHDLVSVEVSIPVSFAGGDSGDVDRLITYIIAPDDDAVPVEEQSAEVLVETPWDPAAPPTHVKFIRPEPTKSEFWRAIVVSASAQAANSLEESPSVRFQVAPAPPDSAGREYAPLALNFHLVNRAGVTTNQPYYDVAEGGATVWGFSARWDNDTASPRFPLLGGYDIDIVYPDGGVETHASKSSNDTSHDSPMWAFGAPGTFSVRLLSWTSQAGNKRNSYVAGVTPERTFAVAMPLGPAGTEYTGLVTAFALNNPYYGTGGQGQKTLYLPFAWNRPTDRDYKGVILFVIRASGTHYQLTGLEPGTSQTVELLQYPPAGTSEQMTFYALSVATTGVNTYVAGVTPSLTFTISGPQDSTPAVSAFTATIFYAKDEFGNNVYGYSGSWANPNKSLNPEYQGVKIIKADSLGANRVPLTGVETGTSFRTSTWTVTPATAIYLYAVSTDVNGNERPIMDSPRVGPLAITAQGGTLTNASLPDIDVANFAAGVEPITFVNAVPDANGFLPASVVQQTTTVFNFNDQRLYRWITPTNRYKVVGSALDIVAATITTGLLAAGAVTSLQMASREILVGPLPSGGGPADQRPPIFKVENFSRQMVGFFGTYQGWEGVYALNLRVGPNFTTPMLEATSTGLTLRGTSTQNVTFELVSNVSDYIRMSPVTFAPTYNSLGMLVSNQSGSSQTYIVSRGAVVYEGTRIIASLARNPNWVGGEVALYGQSGTNIRVLATAVEGGVDRGVVRADRFDCASSPGQTVNYTVSLAAGGSATLTFKGGLLTSP